MSFQSSTYPSQIYRSFRAIDRSEFRRVVRFYERHQKSILMLDFDEYFELLLAYTKSLFEICEYEKHIKMADEVIRISIIENITYVNGEEVYCATLFQKAASYYRLQEFRKAQYIVCELIKINPSDNLNIRFLGRILRDDKPQYVRHTRAISILMFLVSALLICVQVLLVKTFYPTYDGQMEIARNSVFALGILTLVSGEILASLEGSTIYQ